MNGNNATKLGCGAEGEWDFPCRHSQKSLNCVCSQQATEGPLGCFLIQSSREVHPAVANSCTNSPCSPQPWDQGHRLYLSAIPQLKGLAAVAFPHSLQFHSPFPRGRWERC